MLSALLLAAILGRWSNLGPPGAYVSGIAATAGPHGRLFVIATPPGGETTVLRSEDGGANWEDVFEPTFADFPTTIATDPRDADRVFLGTVHAGFSGFTALLYRSLDGGTSWTVRQNFFLASSVDIAFDAVQPDTLYTSYRGIEAVNRSDDGGETFTDFPAPFEDAVLAATPDGALVAASNRAVWLSRDHAGSWMRVTDPPIECLANTVAVDPVSGRWWIGTGDIRCGELVWSDDGGATWTLEGAGGIPIMELVIDPAGARLYMATYSPVSTIGLVFASADDGANWQHLELPIASGAPSIALSSDGRILYATTYEGLYAIDVRRVRTLPARDP